MNRGVALLAGAGLLALAYAVSATTPGQPVVEAPFPSPARLGEQTVSVHLAVTPIEVVLADEVEVEFWRGTTSGVWLAGEITVAATTEPELVSIDVFIDGVRYPASRRLDDGIVDTTVAAGLPSTGPFAVELPADILERPGARSATIRIAAGSESRLDSVVELTVDLTSLEHLDRIEYDPVREGTR